MKIINLMVMSLDGEIAGKGYESVPQRLKIGLTNQDDQDLLRREVEASDAIIIGSGSIRSEGSILDYKNANKIHPTWFIYTNKGLDPALPFWKQTQIPRVMVSKTKLKNLNLEQVSYGESSPAQFLVGELKRRNFKNVLLLGGGELNRVFYSENLVDELKLTIAPVLLASGGKHLASSILKEPIKLKLLNCEAKESYLFLHYKVEGH